MSRMEWRAVSEHSPFQISSNNDSKFCSIKIDGGGGLSEEIVNKRIEEVRREREELEHLEIDLRVRDIVRLEISDAEKRFQLKIKEHADANSQLKDQIQKSKQHIHGLEMQLEEKVKEIQAIRLDNEASWAKDDLLREQNKELVSFRRERDNSEAERVQHMQQMHDLQEHIQEKDSKIIALEEQHRVTQEKILIKDEQLREAQTWIARKQEMDALQCTVLQAQLQERTEHFNQCWMAIQRQFAEVERHHLQTIQQLQTELASAREHNGHDTHKSSEDPSSWTQNNGNHVNANDAAATNFNLSMIFNGSLKDRTHAPSAVGSSENEHPSSVPAVPSVLGMDSCIPPAQVNAVVHPFVIHPQQPISSGDSHIPQPFHPISMFQINQNIDQQQIVTDDVTQNFCQNNQLLSSMEHNQFNSEIPCAKSNHQQNGSVTDGSINEEKMFKSDDKQYQMSIEPQQKSDINMSSHPVSSGSDEQPNEIMGQNKTVVSTTIISASPRKPNHGSVTEVRETVIYPESESIAKTLNQTPSLHTQESSLLDERSLLVCIVRAIPPEAVGRIRISTTLPNRLAKMLSPHHWHDYRKQYGKLDDFLARHPELFVIEGDFIHLRDGAQEIISATTAYAKVAAATAASSTSFSSSFRSVALTPIAQSNRNKTVASFDSKQNRTGFDVLNGLREKNIPVNAESRHAHSSVQYAVGNGTNKGLNNGTKQARSSRSGVSLQKK